MIVPDATSSWRHATVFFMLVALAGIIIYDSLADWLGGDKSTITVVTRDAEASSIIVATVIGILAGHLTGQLWWAALPGYFMGALFWNPNGTALLRRWGLIK